MRRFVWLTLLCWMLSAPLCLQAESSEYERVLEAALAAHARGDLTSARSSMEQAHALSPNARTQRGLAIIAHAQGRHVEAVLYCDAALASEVQALTPKLRASVEELRTRSLSKLAQVRLSLTPADAVVRIDGEPASQRAEGTLLLLPGLHALLVSAPGFVTHERSLDAQAGATETIELTLAPVVVVEPVAQVVPPPEVVKPAEVAKPPVSEPSRGWTRRRRTLTFVLGGVGAVSGGALLIAAARKFSNVDDACAAQPAGGCTSVEAQHRIDDAHVRSFARAGGALLAVGGATLVTGLVLELWSWRASDRVAVAFTPNGALLHARF